MEFTSYCYSLLSPVFLIKRVWGFGEGFLFVCFCLVFLKPAWYEQPLAEASGWKSEAPDSILDSPTNLECGLGQVMRVNLQ